jgi:hypothetical protein
MRVALFFVTGVAAMIAIGALTAGDGTTLALAATVAAAAFVLLWRNLRDPAQTRDGGQFARVTFGPRPAPGLAGTGTQATVRTHRQAWSVVLDRTAVLGDLDLYGVEQRGWVWLDATGNPARVRIDRGSSWKTWPVIGAGAGASDQGHPE